MLCGSLGGKLHLLAGLHILHGAHTLGDFVLAQQHGKGNLQLVGIGHLLLELLLLAVELHPQAGAAQGLSQSDGGGGICGHGQHQGIGRSAGQGGIQQTLLVQDVEQTGQADGDAHTGQGLVDVVARQIVIAAAGADGADLGVIQQGGFVNGAGVVVQAPGNGQIHGKVGFGNAEGGQVGADGLQLGKALIKKIVSVHITFQSGDNVRIGAGDGDELQNFVSLLFGKIAVLQEDGLDLGGADLVQLVHGAHDVAGLFTQLQHGIEAVQNLPVVHPDLEPAQPEALEYLINNGRNLCLVQDIQLAVADDVDVSLVEFPEAASLGTLTAIDLADLKPAEGEGQLVIVQGNVLGQRHRQVEPQGQVAVALGEAVDLLLGFAAALGQQNLGILDDGGVQRGEAVGSVGGAQDFGHFLKTDLLAGQQLHKTGQRPGLNNVHD